MRFQGLRLIRRITKLQFPTILIVGITYIFGNLAIAEPLRLEPIFKYQITTGPGAGQFIEGNPPHLVLNGVIKYYDTPEDAFLEYPAYLEQVVAPIGEMTFQRASNFRPSPKSGIVDGKYDTYCWDVYREINGVSVEPLICTGSVWMKPFCPDHYHLEHTYYRQANRFIHQYSCEQGEKLQTINSQNTNNKKPEKQQNLK